MRRADSDSAGRGRPALHRASFEGFMEVEMKIRGLMMDPVSNMPIVLLKDVGSDTVLPIWVGVYGEWTR